MGSAFARRSAGRALKKGFFATTYPARPGSHAPHFLKSRVLVAGEIRTRCILQSAKILGY